MDRHACKICFRRFSNGRALGGHMRSHLVASSAAQKPAGPCFLQPGDSSASSASGEPLVLPEVVKQVEEQETGEEEDVEEGEAKVTAEVSYRLRENPRKSFRLVDPEFASSFMADEPAGSYVVDQDRQSETESSRATLTDRRRSKRPRRAAADPPPTPSSPPEPGSSVSGTTTDEDVALFLMMLSRSLWNTKPEAEEVHHHASDGSDYEADRTIAVPSPPCPSPPQRSRSRFQCDRCKKVFRSYQALGGHRASHKKNGGRCVPAVATAEAKIYCSDRATTNKVAKVHECPFCFRVFDSGQALGGHKRSHLVACSTATTTIDSPASVAPPASLTPSTSPAAAAAAAASSSVAAVADTSKHSFIDLNLPPMDEEVELSAVSNQTSIGD